MNAMTFIDAREAWAVGNYGYIAHWESALGWKHVKSPTENELYAVSFVAPDNGWIVGDGSEILHWDGTNWSIARSAQTPYRWGWPMLNAVEFASLDDGWALGCIDTEGGSGLWGLRWDGKDWREFPGDLYPASLMSGSYCFTDIEIISPTDIWAVGGGDKGITLHWNGSSWYEPPNPANYWLFSVRFTTSDTGWAVGIDHTREGSSGIALRWNGTEWVDMQLSTGWINSAIIPSENETWVGGDDLLYWDSERWWEFEKPTLGWDRIVDMEIAPGGQIWALTERGAFLRLGIVAR